MQGSALLEQDLQTPRPSNSSALQEKISRALSELFKKPAVLATEDWDAYKTLKAAVIAELQPSGVIEMCWVQDFIDATWQIQRNRRLQKGILEVTEMEAARALLRERIDDGRADRSAIDSLAALRAQDFFHSEFDVMKNFDITQDQLTAECFVRKVKALDVLDNQTTRWMRLRSKLLRDLEMRRDKRGKALAKRARDFVGMELFDDSSRSEPARDESERLLEALNRTTPGVEDNFPASERPPGYFRNEDTDVYIDLDVWVDGKHEYRPETIFRVVRKRYGKSFERLEDANKFLQELRSSEATKIAA